MLCNVTACMFDPLPPESSGWPLSAPERAERLAASIQQLQSLSSEYGISALEIFDLSDPNFNAECYRGAVRNADVYYSDIGNTWALLHYLRLRGQEELIERVQSGELLYVGNSAGGIVAGKSVETALWKNWDDMWSWQQGLPQAERTDWKAPRARKGLDILGGVSFFPHHASRWIPVARERGALMDHEVCLCANGHGVVVDAGSARLVSPEGCLPHMAMF